MPDFSARGPNSGFPYLEHYPEPGGIAQCLVLDQFPFRIGRCSTANFVIYSSKVSKDHAEIIFTGTEYRIRDPRSTNGTFVNGQRIVEAPLNNGDIIHVAHKEFRFGSATNSDIAELELNVTEAAATDDLPANVLQGGAYLRDLLNQHRVTTVFQPIVDLTKRECIGYEALGRGSHDKLSPNPKELFYLAEKCKLAQDLSRLFRRVAVREAVNLPAGLFMFLNFHPSEMRDESWLAFLEEQALNLGNRYKMVVEVHEDSVTDMTTLLSVRDRLKSMGVLLAYDDFGSGQARITELTDCPPDFIKLDFKLVRGIHEAKPRQEIVGALGRVCNDLGVQIIAEGIEALEEAETCLELGCRLGQGFLYGQPQPASFYVPKKPDTRRLDRNQFLQRLRSLQS
jgi:EAL domain-containing protein (putative c-di-GMP-specific phosphodiesterase class I)